MKMGGRRRRQTLEQEGWREKEGVAMRRPKPQVCQGRQEGRG